MSAIRLKSVSKAYETEFVRTNALQDVSLDIAEGEFLTIVGTSGSGKSTLLSIIGLLQKPDEGEIEVVGRSTKGMSSKDVRALRGKNIGYVFQAFHLVETLSVRDNVMLSLRSGSLDKPSRRAAVDGLLSRLGLEGRADHFPAQLSGGQQQRVAIARAVANQPSIIVADEPTGNLDTETSAQVMLLLGELHDAGTTLVCVTHSLDVAAHGSRTIRIEDGRLA